MPAILQYLLKLSVSAGVIYAFYYLVLRRLTFYHLNRWYLTGYTLLCLVIPFININPIVNKADVQLPALNYIPMVQNIKNYVPPRLNEATPYAYNMWNILVALLAIGSIVLLVKLTIQLISFIHLRRKAELISDDGTVIYHIDEQIMPFSFGNSIYLNKTLHTKKELAEIIMHEYVHVKQMHSADILIAELFCVLNWYNPFAWLIRNSIRQNLEFIADDNVVRSGIDKKAYQYHLLKVVGIPQYRLANQFNFSSLKKRIIMMNRSKSAKIHLLKFMFILPLLAVTLMAFRSDIVNTVNKISARPMPAKVSSNSTIPVNTIGVVTDWHKNTPVPHANDKGTIRPDSVMAKSMNVTAYFDGEVLKTKEIRNSYIIVIRNGDRFDSYSNLTSVNVKKDDKIKKGQLLGTVDIDSITGIPQLRYSMYKGRSMVYIADGNDTAKRSYNNVYISGYGTNNLSPAAKNYSYGYSATASSGAEPVYVTAVPQVYNVAGAAPQMATGTVVFTDNDTMATASKNKVIMVTGYAIKRDNPADELVYTIDPRHMNSREFSRMEKQFADNGFKLKINSRDDDKLNIHISGAKDNSTSSASFSGDDLRNSTSYIKITGDKNTGLVSIASYPLGK